MKTYLYEFTKLSNMSNISKNTRDFVGQIQGIQLQQGECVSSYDVSALYTSVPIDPAINIIRRQLELDQDVHLRTSMTVEPSKKQFLSESMTHS